MSVPERYDDSLAARVFPHRFRRVGNPYAFLNDIGIVPILEYIYKGNLLIDVAEALNVSYTVLQAWVEQEGYDEKIQEAQKISAEGYLAEGLRRLRQAKNEFELKRAKEMVAHARFKASKKDKTTYGSTEQTGVEKAGVSYVFNIGGNVITHQAPAQEEKQAIDAEAVEVPRVSMDILGHLNDKFDDLFGVPAQQPKAPTRAGEPFRKVELPPEPPRPSAPVQPRSAAHRQPKRVGKPTRLALPEIGPFHD